MRRDRARSSRWAAGLAALVSLGVGVAAAPAAALPDSFAFAVQPGTDRWARFTSYQQMVDATQMPAGTARRLSTAALARATLAHPLFGDVLAFNNSQRGLDRFAARFRGAAELLRRRDAGPVLLGRYEAAVQRADQQGLLPPPEPEQDRTRVELWQLETLLGQPRVLAGLAAAQLDRALAVGERAYARKAAQPRLYGLGGLEATGVALGRALAVREGWDWRRSRLLRGEPAPSADAVERVRAAVAAHRAAPGARHALADDLPPTDRPTEPGDGGERPVEPGDGGERPVEPGDGGGRPVEPGDGDDPDGGPAPTGDEPVVIRTPRGTHVTALRIGSEMTESELRYVQLQIESRFPRAVQESSPTRRYNCHSFAWYSQSRTNDIWLDDPGDDAFIGDGSYRRWESGQPARDGMRVSWVYDDHSGIEVGRSGEIRAKWGRMPLMRAPVEYDPYDDLVLDRYVRQR